MSPSPSAQLVMLTGASPGSGKSTALLELARRCRRAGRDVMVVDEDAVWGQRRLDDAPVDPATVSPLFRQLLHHWWAEAGVLQPDALVGTFASLVGEALERNAMWLQDWSWSDLLAVSGWDDDLVAVTSRRLREAAVALDPRVLYLQVDAHEALQRAVEQRGPVWFNRHAGRPVQTPVTASAVAEVAALKQASEPAVIELLAGWPMTWIDASGDQQEVNAAVWQAVHLTRSGHQGQLVRIRPAVLDDAAAIANVNASAWKTAFAGVVSDQYLSSYDGAPQRRRDDLLAVSADAAHLVAEDDGRVVGWSMGHPSEDEDCDPCSVYEVRACYVAPTHWRTGTGRRLVQHLLAGLDRDRWREVVVWTPRDTAPTRAFYASLGFEPDGKTVVIDRLGPVPLVRLRRALPIGSTAD